MTDESIVAEAEAAITTAKKTTKKPARGKKPVTIEIPEMQIKRLDITLIGDSPLVTHAWSDKAKKMILDKQMKKAKQAKEARDPWGEFLDSMYWMTQRPMENPDPDKFDPEAHTFGFPAIAFKVAAVDACSYCDGITKVAARGTFHVDGDLIEINGTPEMREDMVRIGMGTADLRYRAEFKEWSVTLPVRYNARVLSAEQVVNLFQIAGFAVGVGEHRPQKDGTWGTFHVEGS